MIPGLVIALAIAGGFLIGWAARGALELVRILRRTRAVEGELTDRAGA